MFCDGCSERMTRETIVFVSRRIRRGRSIATPGWYCWTCKRSRRDDASGPDDATDMTLGPLLRRVARAVSERYA